MSKSVSPSEILSLFRPGMMVFVAGGGSEARTIARVLHENPEATAGVHFVVSRIPGIESETLRPFAGAKTTTFFVTSELRQGYDDGSVVFSPMQYRQIFDVLAGTSFDLAIGQLSLPNDAGQCSLGISADFFPAILDHGATPVLAELNARMPFVASAPSVPADRLTYHVESDERLPELHSEVTDAAVEIARRVARLVKDGACIETGVGSIPSAVLASLSEHNDLGFHSGLLTDGVMDLVQRGVINGIHKPIDTTRTVAGMALGSRDLYDWAAEDDSLKICDASYTHDVRVLSMIDDFVAINSAVEIDLYGQVNSESVRGRQISGIGGAVDFMRGAALARGGRSIVAFEATAGGGKYSRVVARLPERHPATALRSDADVFVTEFGTAAVARMGVEERAEALIELAAPEFRDELRAAWRERP